MGGSGLTRVVAWLLVLLGGVLLVGNLLELGGAAPSSRVWSAWVLAGMVLLHGLSLAWRAEGEDESAGLRLPRWPLAGLPLVLWLGFAWWHDQRMPGVAQETFYLAAQAWLVCWMVAATPGGRAFSWAWLLLVAGVALAGMLTAVCWQRGTDALWLPMGRSLPAEWSGRWSGTLALPGAFGALMVLAASPLLVMAGSRRLTMEWRLLIGYAGLMLLSGALGSYSAGAWLGVFFLVIVLPLVVSSSPSRRMLAWGVGLGCLALLAVANATMGRYGADTMGWAGLIQMGEPTFSDAWKVLRNAWEGSGWCGGFGQPYADLSLAAGVTGQGGGWSYGFSDWMDLATAWGVVGLGLGLGGLGGLLAAGWASWLKLPHLVLPGGTSAGSGRKIQKHSPSQATYTPETKVLLGASALSVSAFTVVMLGSRGMNLPAVIYAFAVVAGVLARNIPQRGGSWRLESVTRWLGGLGVAVLLAGWLVWRVAPAAQAQGQLEQAEQMLKQLADQPRLLEREPELLSQIESALLAARAANPNSAPVLADLAMVYVEQSQLDPANFQDLSQRALQTASDAAALAPQAPAPRLAQAVACLLDNRVDDAAAHVREAFNLDPTDPPTQYYAVAILALDPSTRPLAGALLLSIRRQPYNTSHVSQLEAAYNWAQDGTVPLDGVRQRPPPPPYQSVAPWPPLTGLPRDAVMQQPAAPTTTPPPAPPANTTNMNLD